MYIHIEPVDEMPMLPVVGPNRTPRIPESMSPHRSVHFVGFDA